MIYNNDNLKVCLAAPASLYAQWRDEQSALGFRTLSLSVAGPTSVPIYTAVMTKLAAPFRGRSDPTLTRAQLDKMVADMAADGAPLHPYILSATDSGSNIVYAAAFRALPFTPVMKPNMTAQQFADENEAQRTAGNMPIWIDSFGTGSAIRYCALYGPNSDHLGWSADEPNDKGEARQQRFDAMVSMRARPSLVAMTPDGGLARLYVDNALKHGWVSKASMDGNGMQAAMTEQAKEGRYPVRIGTEVIDNVVRFSALFAKSDEIMPRSFRKKGPGAVQLDTANATKAAKIDDWMEDYMKAQGMRNASLAVVEGTKLVFTRGYTMAEADYPDAEPTTLYRLASVSKTFTAVAAWKALHDDPNHSRNSRMQDILNLTPLPQAALLPQDFGKITVRHLLESCSGIDQNGMRGSMKKIRDETSDAQPASVNTLARMVAGLEMPGQPGGPTVYGRTDYFLLGMIAAKLSNTPNFDAALKKLVLDPLKMTRTRGSKSRIEDRLPDEAMHHAPNLPIAKSAVHTDRHLVPGHYGGENYDVFDGPGGVSSSAVDVARLTAMFSCRLGNPVLPADVLQEMLEDAVAATDAGTHHGYHGFDGASGVNPLFAVSKGGSLPGVRTGFTGTTGQRFVVMLRNCEGVEGATPSNWKVDLHALAAAVDWGSGDLFPQYGMPTLGLQAMPKDRTQTQKVKPIPA